MMAFWILTQLSTRQYNKEYEFGKINLVYVKGNRM
jgi:hypothetical protein